MSLLATYKQTKEDGVILTLFYRFVSDSLSKHSNSHKDSRV